MLCGGLIGLLGCASGDLMVPGPPLSWSRVASGTANNLWDVWGSSATDVWAVGDFGTVLHYDGIRWQAALDSVSHFFRGVWGSGPRDIWAVGFHSLDSTVPVIFHYDGQGWARDASIADTVPRPQLTDVWGASASNVWAAGYGGRILHFDGSRWTNDPADPAYHERIWGTSASDVWIVGPGAVLHYDGSRWSSQSDSLLTVKQLFSGWGASRSDQWAVGFLNNGFLHFDGSHWTRVAPADSAAGFGYGMWGVAPSRIWVVERTGSTGPGTGAVWQFNGTRWSVVARDTVNLTGIWASSGSDVWAVGDLGTILHGTVAP